MSRCKAYQNGGFFADPTNVGSADALGNPGSSAPRGFYPCFSDPGGPPEALGTLGDPRDPRLRDPALHWGELGGGGEVFVPPRPHRARAGPAPGAVPPPPRPAPPRPCRSVPFRAVPAAMSAPEPGGPGGPGLSFAEGLLRRHGWRQGKGLGKREDGISQALRVRVKCDSAGVGHNAAEQFSFHWWDHVFNESAANIAVEDGQDGVCVRTLGEQRAGISNKKPRKAAGAGCKLYGRFVKAATLTARGEEPAKLPAGSESSEEEEEEKLDRSSARRLTDEELVRACGGRTAHKGARHGLTMSAKLARLEEQERAFLATYQQKREQPQSAELQEKKKKKKKKKRAGDGAEAEAPQSCEPNGEEEVEGEEEKVVKRKKKKKKDKEELAETELPLEEAEGAEQAGHSPKKKKRKKKRREEE
ncbi:G patch domain-containing protein 4 [Cygnus olor]|uniref:G patch domain-containing protein 4 n=1 Tax=Cygnus olor TaxID=8869 RepID=UPI001ADE895C|nr:G patch domain-containing protein 4 [Cygnus olor]